MKSKRAITYMYRAKITSSAGRYIGKVATDTMVIKAVELAEEDARERAARTFCKLQRLDCEIYCTPCAGAGCFGRNEFLKHYDNEEK